MLWRRLDSPGHDACRLEKAATGWQLDGTAVFHHDDGPAQLVYRVACNLAWHTRYGEVHGWLGSRVVGFKTTRTMAGVWTLNGSVISDLANCVDLDLGFTPATNLLQLRRLELAIGRQADVPVAWLDPSAGTLEVLHQSYERRSETTYWYQAPRFEYAALLEVTPTGFVRSYPGLWESEA